MRAPKRDHEVADEASKRSRIKVGTGCSVPKVSSRTTGGKRCKNITDAEHLNGDNDITSVGKENISSPTESFSENLQVKESGDFEKTNNVQSVRKSYAKIKLQLFPIDETTREGLEKDGHNPHLELILSKRKKISSVINHLSSKWASSSTVTGELMLFPYDIRLDNLSEYKQWTLKDKDTADDVYTAIERPSVFRLRYGWFPHLERSGYFLSRTASCFADCLRPEDLKKVSNMDGKTRDDQGSAQKENSEIDVALSLSSSLWGNISIGGLLSEESLQPVPSSSNARPTGTGSYVQQVPFSCDSFDAAIAAHILSQSQSRQKRTAMQSSIYDAEETCDAFPSQKLASILDAEETCHAHASSNSFKFPCSFEEKSRGGLYKPIPRQEPQKTSSSPQTQGVDNSTNSLGLGDIKWSQGDSLGPLGFSLSSQPFINSDSMNFSNLFAMSRDKIQSSSMSTSDVKVAPS
ncbi:TSL-kinase interacting protein 1-like isoform X2 [Papaver somniferum]|uniref:TSL-kinase interacting protein 1-like isoform X2 n=1 Tax=Papaver somniferum TaxID=3469 RepID=UPI000E704606|nr:TSL-kinase interacting protein 1-like isoform X2 [Papaver somniferum]